MAAAFVADAITQSAPIVESEDSRLDSVTRRC